jgi:hypothetical protein
VIERIDAFHAKNKQVVKLADHRRRLKEMLAALNVEPVEMHVGLWFEGEHNTNNETCVEDDMYFLDVSTAVFHAMLKASVESIEAQLDDLLGDPMDGREEDRDAQP